MATKRRIPKESQVVTIQNTLAGMGLPPIGREVYFAVGRQWRFDLAWPDLMVAIEYEGDTWGASRHNTGMGYRLDVDKYNHAAAMGWCVIRATADMVRDMSYLDAVVTALARVKPELFPEEDLT